MCWQCGFTDPGHEHETLSDPVYVGYKLRAAGVPREMVARLYPEWARYDRNLLGTTACPACGANRYQDPESVIPLRPAEWGYRFRCARCGGEWEQ